VTGAFGFAAAAVVVKEITARFPPVGTLRAGTTA
jgi:hypothetical protein